MDRIDQLRIFTRVIETRSFTKAADTLGMPRSSVSTAVADLEARGVKFVDVDQAAFAAKAKDAVIAAVPEDIRPIAEQIFNN